jgi:hypothetical protein
MAYKVFTNGSVLNASEINENLMSQATAVFSNAAARTAAITSPVEGQLTYLEDTNLYSMWNGSSWVTPFGLTLLANQVFTSATAVNLSNILTSEYSRYRVMINATSASGSPQLWMRFRENTTDVTTQYYGGLSEVNFVGTTTTFGMNNLSVFVLARDISPTGSPGSIVSFDLYRRADAGVFSGHGYNRNESASFHVGGDRTSMTNFTGLSFFPDSSNMTGAVKVYGYKEGF